MSLDKKTQIINNPVLL